MICCSFGRSALRLCLVMMLVLVLVLDHSLWSFERCHYSRPLAKLIQLSSPGRSLFDRCVLRLEMGWDGVQPFQHLQSDVRVRAGEVRSRGFQVVCFVVVSPV